MNPLNLLMNMVNGEDDEKYPEEDLENYKIYPLQFTATDARRLATSNEMLSRVATDRFPILREPTTNHPSIIILEQNILMSILKRGFECAYVLSDLNLKEPLDSALTDGGYSFTSKHPIHPRFGREDRNVLMYKVKW